MLIFPPEIGAMCAEAARITNVEGMDWSEFGQRDAPETELPQASTDDIAYLQYSSGSTRFPHGVAITHHALLNNLAAHSHGMQLQRRRSLRLLAALVSRHGAGRLLPVGRSPTRSRPIISRPRISRGARWPGSI
jgi:acyl-CoA synthetase (AMP-forming)/AMP-acid ligase II